MAANGGLDARDTIRLAFTQILAGGLISVGGTLYGVGYGASISILPTLETTLVNATDTTRMLVSAATSYAFSSAIIGVLLVGMGALIAISDLVTLQRRNNIPRRPMTRRDWGFIAGLIGAVLAMVITIIITAPR